MDSTGPLDRRAFVRTMTAAAAVMPALSALAASDDPLVTGTGDFRFRVEHDWLVPPGSIRWGDTHGLAQDKAGRIYVSHTVGANSEKKDAIVVFGPDGKFLSSWGERFAGGGHGLDLREENGVEYLYHCDVNRRKLAKTTLDGTLVWEVGAPLAAKARDQACYANEGEWNPTNVCFAPDGDVFVGDGYGKSFVHRFGADGAWKATLTTPGSAAGETSCPHGLWVDARKGEPTLLVADRGNHRLQRFTLDGKHLGFETEACGSPATSRPAATCCSCPTSRAWSRSAARTARRSRNSATGIRPRCAASPAPSTSRASSSIRTGRSSSPTVRSWSPSGCPTAASRGSCP